MYPVYVAERLTTMLLAEANDQVVEAAVSLLSGADAERVRISVPLPPGDVPERERLFGETRRRLGEEAFRHVWEVGQTLTLSQLLEPLFPTPPEETG
jgi:hypothetical protein